MKNEIATEIEPIVTEIGPEDVRLILNGEAPSLRLRAALYERLTRRRLQSLSPMELRAEFEFIFDNFQIVDLFFWNAERGIKTSNEQLIDILTDSIMDSYNEKMESGEDD